MILQSHMNMMIIKTNKNVQIWDNEDTLKWENKEDNC